MNENKKVQENVKNKIPQGLIDNPAKWVRERTPSEKRVMDYLLSLSFKYDKVLPAQSTIAHHAGISLRYCRSIIKKFMDMGLFDKKQRWNTSCLYYIADFFRDPNTRSQLSHIFKSCRYLPLVLLVAFGSSKSIQSEYNSPINIKAIRFNIIYNKHPLGDYGLKVFGENPISPAIRNLTFLNLSKWGQIKLSAFPDEAIIYAQDQMEYRTSVKDPYRYFFKQCLDYCNDNNIKPDWQWVKQLSVSYKMPDNPRLVLDQSHPSATPRKALTLKPKVITSKAFIKKEEESVVKRLYPDYVAPKPQQRDERKDKEFCKNWLEGEDSRAFLQFMGKEDYDKFVRNLLEIEQ